MKSIKKMVPIISVLLFLTTLPMISWLLNTNYSYATTAIRHDSSKRLNAAHSTTDTHMSLISQSPWVSSGQPLHVSLSISSNLPVNNLELVISLYPLLTSRSAFQTTLNVPPFGQAISSIAPINVTIPTTTLNIGIDQQPAPTGTSSNSSNLYLYCTITSCNGVYPIQTELIDRQNGQVFDSLTTYLIYVGSSANTVKLRLDLIFPIQASLQHRRSHINETYLNKINSTELKRLSDLITGLSKYPQVPFTLSLSPQTIQLLLHQHGLLSDLKGMIDNPKKQIITPLSYVPINAELFSRTPFDSYFAQQLLRGKKVFKNSFSNSANTANMTVPTWIDSNPLNYSTLDLLANNGIEDMVVTSNVLQPTTTYFTPTQPFWIAGQTVQHKMFAVLANTGLAAHFTQTTDPALNANQFLADVAQIYFNEPNASQARGLVCIAAANWQSEKTFLPALLSGITNNPIIEPVTLSTLFNTVPPGINGEPSVWRLASFRLHQYGNQLPTAKLTQTADLIAAAQSATAVNAPFVVTANDLLLDSEAAGLDPNQQSGYLNLADKTVKTQLSLLSLQPDRTITLTARKARIPISIISKMSISVHGTLKLVSPNLQFPNGPTQPVRLTTRNNSFYFNIKTTTSGEFPLKVYLEAPNGKLTLVEGIFTIRSQAVSFVAIILMVGALVLLLAWWINVIRKSSWLHKPLHKQRQ
ncbi:MAG: DUF6049 family protein [Actinobacteria bacterium]|nr:DUF6049 family protein [Actinomycetota bacterium]